MIPLSKYARAFGGVIALLAIASQAWAANRYWVAAGSSGTWTATSSWATTSGGASGASAPGAADHAIFDGNRQTPCILNATVIVASMTISTSTTGGFTGYVDTSTRTLTVTQNFVMNRGTFYARTSSITVQGNWTVDPAAAFIANTSSVTFLSTASGWTIQTGNQPFYNLIFNGTGGSWTGVNQPVTVSSAVQMLGGALTVSGTSWTVAGGFNIQGGSTLTISHDLQIGGGALSKVPAGRIEAGNSTSTLRLSGTGVLGGTGSRVWLPNLDLSGAGQTTTLAGPVTLLGALSNGAGHTLDPSASNYGLTVAGSWLNSGSYTIRAASVTFNGSSAGRSIQTAGQALYLARIDGTGSWTGTGGPLTITNNLVVNRGTFTVVAGSSLTVVTDIQNTGGVIDFEGDTLVSGGDITNTGGSIVALGTATVTLSGAGILGGTGLTQIGGLALSGAAQTTTLGGALTLTGVLSNGASHTLDVSASNYAVTISSHWTNAGTFNARSGSVTFAGAGTEGRITTNNWRFNVLDFAGGSWVGISNPVTVSSAVFVDAGTYRVAATSLSVTGNLVVAAGATLDVGQNILISGGSLGNAGTIVSLSTPIVTLSGAGTLGGPGTSGLPQVTLSAAGTTTLAGDVVFLGSATIASGHTLDANAAGNYQITVSSWWANNGTFTPRLGTMRVNAVATLTGLTTFYNLVASAPGITIQFQARTTFYVLNSLTLTGSIGSELALRSSVNGTQWLLVSNGAESVTAVDVRDSDARFGGAIAAANSIDSGNNRNWSFGDARLRTWWGSTNTDWSNNANWDTIAPASSFDSALIVSTATRMPTLTANVAVTTVTVVAQSSLTLNGFDLTPSSFAVRGILVLFGNEDVSLAPDLGNGSTVQYNAPSGTMVIYSTWTYENLWLAGGSAAWFTPTGNLTVDGALTFTSGLFQHNSGAITMTGNGGVVGMTSSGQVLYDLNLNGSASRVLIDSMTVANTLTINAGTLDARTGVNSGISLGGDWLNTGGTYLARNSSVTLSGSNAHRRIRSNGSPFWKLLVSGPGEWSTDTNPVTVSSTILVNAGTLNVIWPASTTIVGVPVVAAGATLNVEGDLGLNGGAINAAGQLTANSTATVTVTGAGTLAGTGSLQFPRLTLSGAAATTTLGNRMAVNGELTNGASHTLDVSAGNYAITVSSHWTNAGTFTMRAGSVTFNGSAAGQVIASNNSPFYTLRFNGPGTWRHSSNAVTVSSYVQVDAGTYNVGGSSLTVITDIDINAGGAMDISHDVLVNGGDFLNEGTVTGSTGTLTLVGAGTLAGSGSTSLPRLTLSGAGTTTMGGAVVLLGSATIATGHTLDTNAAGNYQITISSWWANNGTFTPRQGTVRIDATATLTGSTTFYDLDMDVPGITLTIQAGTTQYVTNAWTLAGASGNRIRLRSTTTGLYTFRVAVSSFVSQVDVDRCVSSSQTIYAGQTSVGTNTTNWVFNYPPNTVTTLSAGRQLNGDVALTWTVPSDPDDSPLGAGSTYAIQWATYTVAWSTSAVGDTGQTATKHIYLSTGPITAGNSSVYFSTGLLGNVTYYFQVWTRDPLGLWSFGLSNQANEYPSAVIGVGIDVVSYNFGTVSLNTTTISTSAAIVTNAGNVSQTYSLSAAPQGGSIWSIKASTPTAFDQYVLFGQFNSGQPTNASFVAADSIVGTPTAASASVYAGNQTGLNVPAGAARNLWLRLDMPLSSSTTDQHLLNLDVSAASP